jgi:hypothetical protein
MSEKMREKIMEGATSGFAEIQKMVREGRVEALLSLGMDVEGTQLTSVHGKVPMLMAMLTQFFCDYPEMFWLVIHGLSTAHQGGAGVPQEVIDDANKVFRSMDVSKGMGLESSKWLEKHLLDGEGVRLFREETQHGNA